MSPPRLPAEVIETKYRHGDETSTTDTTLAGEVKDMDTPKVDKAEDAPAAPSTDMLEEMGSRKDDPRNTKPEQDSTSKELVEEPPQVPEKDSKLLDNSATSSMTGQASSPEDLMASSTATLKPDPANKHQESSGMKLSLPSHVYLDLTPDTPGTSKSNSRATSYLAEQSSVPRKAHTPERSPTRSDTGYDDRSASEDEREKGSNSEIQSIMDQFSEEGGGPGEEEVMSPRLEFAGPLLGAPIQHPPRKSSLEHLNSTQPEFVQNLENLRLASNSPTSTQSRNEQGPQVPPKPSSISFSSARGTETRSIKGVEGPMSPSGSSIHRPPPPEPEPEPDLPFDFHRFLEQLRHKTADPVAKFLRSFLSEFGKKQWMVHEQVKIISDFLAFITNKMGQCEVWRDVSDAEFDNAREGMEKLVMNRLYTQTFSPAIAPPQPIPGSRPRRKGTERPLGPGRRGQHQEDVERDDVLAQKVSIYGWVQEQHLDIEPVGDSGKRFLLLAQQEILKIKTYRAPRDKIICVLNCCKVIFGLLKHSKSDGSADSFMPLLIYVVLQANPDHLVSNVQYILRFRNQEKLGGEAGYYLSSLMGAIQFIENLDRTTLTITDEDFERNVEAAVSAIAEKHQQEEVAKEPVDQPLSEKSSAKDQSHQTLQSSYDGESSTARVSMSSNEDEASMTGLLRTIQRPLSSIGRIFSEDGGSSQPARTPLPGNTPRMSPAPRTSSDRGPQRDSSRNRVDHPKSQRSAEEAAARQASAEAAEAQRLQQAEHANVVETLTGMFPNLDKDIISDVVLQKNGRVAQAVDACLALSS